MAQFKGVGFRSPRFLHSDHRAVVTNIWVGRKGRLKNYRRARQKFPLTPPLGPKDANTTTFDALAARCVEPKKKRSPGKDWISKGTWRLITKRTSLLRSRKIRQAAARRMKREVQAALKADKSRLTAKVGESIVSEFSQGNVQEAFRHLKGWYRAASETHAKPCHQTMEHQTDEQVELYAERAAYGARFALDILVETFKRVGLATDMKKTQAMVCMLGKIKVQLPMDFYRSTREGVAAGEEGK